MSGAVAVTAAAADSERRTTIRVPMNQEMICAAVDPRMRRMRRKETEAVSARQVKQVNVISIV